MKKGLILFGFGLLVLSSCVKDRTCECVTTYTDGTSETNNITIKSTKKTAETTCDSYESSVSGWYTEACALK